MDTDIALAALASGRTVLVGAECRRGVHDAPPGCAWKTLPREVCLDPRLLYNCTVPRFGVELPKDHTVKNVLLVNALLTILFLSDTYGGRTHDLRIAETTPYPLPAGSGLLQDLGFLSFTLPDVEILMPTKKPRGHELTWEQHLANQALHQRRLRIEHVNSSVKRCRIVKDRIRLWKEGVRDLVMELCCALHNFRVRLNPWLPMV